MNRIAVLRTLALAFAAVLLGACGSDAPPSAAVAAPPEKTPTFIDPQLKALEEAKKVEQMLKDEKKKTDDAIREIEGG